MNLSENTIKNLLTAVVGSVGGIMLFGETGSSNIANMITLPTYIVIGASAGIGGFTADMFSDNIIRRLPTNPKLKNAESLAVRLGLAGGATSLALKLTTGLPNENVAMAFGLGAASKIGGEWLNNNVVSVKRSGFILQ